MNKEWFYNEIGNIDDDLIQEAGEVYRQKRKNTVVYRIAAIAACFCLVCGAVLFNLQKDNIYINIANAPIASKIVVPSGDNVEILSMTYQELLSYYAMEKMPSALSGDLARAEQSFFVIYKDKNGNVLHDTNTLYYSTPDSEKNVSIYLAKNDDFQNVQGDIVYSKISNTSVVLGKSQIGTDYWAGFKLKEVSVRMFSYGLSQDEFIDAVKEIISTFQ